MPYGLFLDLVIIALLGATIFYAMRLSRYLEQFRSNRADMERLIRDLSIQITRAQEGISTLDVLAKENADELRGLLNKGVALADELQLITQAGDSLANRLEQLSVRARTGESAPEPQPIFAAPPRKQKQADISVPPQPAPAQTQASALSSALFSIRDPDFEEDDEEHGALKSRAEKDLARALSRQKK
jgi:hypothetical protein